MPPWTQIRWATATEQLSMNISGANLLSFSIHGTWKEELNKARNYGLLALFITSVVMFRGHSQVAFPYSLHKYVKKKTQFSKMF